MLNSAFIKAARLHTEPLTKEAPSGASEAVGGYIAPFAKGTSTRTMARHYARSKQAEDTGWGFGDRAREIQRILDRHKDKMQ